MGSTIPSQQRYPDLSQQNSYSNLFSSFGAQAASTMGIGDEHRPATATGVPQSISMAQHNPQSSHHSHDSMGSSRGGSYSHSPDMVRAVGFSDRFQLPSQLPNPSRQTGRFEDQSQMATGLYQRNSLPALPAEPILTSNTDSGIDQTSLHYNPDLSHQSVEEHVADSR